MNQKTPQEYQEEMLRLYRQAHPVAEEIPAQPQPQPEPVPEPEPEPEREPEPLPDACQPTEELPLPEALPVLTDTNDSFGFLKITTRRAGGALPLSNTSIHIFQQTPAGKALIYTALTNESGESEKIRLSAPSPKGIERIQPFAIYEVLVAHDGYVSMQSNSLPIYAGITSIQNFQMIPLPMSSTEAQHPIMYSNPEPNF